jgi:uncharacterized delta-60 repeat protein
MSFTLLGILNSQAGLSIDYWIATLGGASDDQGFSVAIDSSNSFYALGATKSAGGSDFDFLLVKYDTLGAVQWQRILGGENNDLGYSVKVDSSDNVYAFGYSFSDEAFLLAKYNSSGTIQWQRTLEGAGTDEGTSVAIDSADNLYVFGFTTSAGAGNDDFLLAKYNSSGTIQWQRILGGSGIEEGYSVAVDSSDNVYVFGTTKSVGAGDSDFLLAKYNSSGTIQWQRVLGGAGRERGDSVTFDSSDNVYVLGDTPDGMLLVKYNSSGTVQWQKTLSGSTRGLSLAIDSSDNVYAFGYTGSSGAGSLDYLLAKYDTSGAVQWQRTLGTTGLDIGYGVTVDSLGSVFVLGYTNSGVIGGSDFLLAKLPSNGSLTGTYSLNGTDVTYAASTLTAGTSTLTAATSSLTAATSSLTSATSTLTAASSSLTSHLVEL